MKKYRVEVTITQEYIVEIDETIYDDAWQKDFEETFWPLGSNKYHGIVEALAFGRGVNKVSFYEGFGPVKINGAVPYNCDEDKMAEGLNIQVVSEDEETEFDIEEIV